VWLSGLEGKRTMVRFVRIREPLYRKSLQRQNNFLWVTVSVRNISHIALPPHCFIAPLGVSRVPNFNVCNVSYFWSYLCLFRKATWKSMSRVFQWKRRYWTDMWHRKDERTKSLVACVTRVVMRDRYCRNSRCGISSYLTANFKYLCTFQFLTCSNLQQESYSFRTS